MTVVGGLSIAEETEDIRDSRSSRWEESEGEVEAWMVANWSWSKRSAAAISTGLGVACGLLCVFEGVEAVVICESWLKNEDMEGRRARGILVCGLMLCSTGVC